MRRRRKKIVEDEKQARAANVLAEIKAMLARERCIISPVVILEQGGMQTAYRVLAQD